MPQHNVRKKFATRFWHFLHRTPLLEPGRVFIALAHASSTAARSAVGRGALSRRGEQGAEPMTLVSDVTTPSIYVEATPRRSSFVKACNGQLADFQLLLFL